MSDVTPPEPMLPEPPGRDRRLVWTALASVMVHAGVLAFLLWQPLPVSAEAAPPPSIDVELVLPPVEEPTEQALAEPAAAPPADTAAAEPPEPEQAADPSTAEASAPDMAADAEAPETPSGTSEATAASASEVEATATSEPPQDAEASAVVAPVPLPRPKVRGLTAPSSAPEESVAAPAADSDAMAEGAAPAGSTAVPDVATLELGTPHSAERFYLEAMLSAPSMAPAREMLQTLPPEKRLAQTCNIEALAQIGNAGEGFAPDVVMAEAYALSEMSGTRLTASGAIFRSAERWYGVAFDCTLSDDLTRVTAFSYRLGTDVTDAVLARLAGN
jgi:outer membrane biosynthesis protein TonB